MRRLGPPVLLLLLAACGGDAGGPGPAPGADFAVERTASGGPVTLAVRLSRDEIGLADTVVLEEEVRAEEGFAAELPEYARGDLDGLGVVDATVDPPVHEGGVTVLRRRLTLEPERSGTLTIPAREAWFHREGEDAESLVASEPIELTVDPIEDPESLELPAPRPLIRPEEIAGEERASPYWWGLLGVPLLAAAVVLWRRRRRPAPPPRPAHELAWEALRRLAAANLLEEGETERFFVVLSAILREYVERRFGVRAPERTTREFLAEASAHPSLAGHRERLGGFLVLADRVKFARHEPGEADVQSAFDTAKAFVEATQETAHA